MSLLLRACQVGSKYRTFNEIQIVAQNFTCLKCGLRNPKLQRFAPALQFQQYSTNEDEKPDGLQLIYTGLLNKRILQVKAVSLMTSFMSIGSLPVILRRTAEGSSDVASSVLLTLMTAFIFSTPLYLHLITRSYALHIYYNPKKDNYIVERYTLLLKKQQMEFTPEDVTIPCIDRMFASVFIKNKPIFMDVKNFTDFDHYNRIMGYDKPLDLKFEENTDVVSSDTSQQVKSSDNKK